ncbi:aliphatic sulfonate ABC transporter substrate-binding protein [Streptacidiphilus sp. PB12-B1b]|uniref:aliphatic sulfonate ABC transporter substrate-binding protein n=1 Tax=Streptacidiphilus sp. PB12-B1b TaxID=2705012 RepID=UPI0015FD931A|nr:aliphatic sulfonate ABC transporter substrate-binding protein [Streptacidiphilus sp. PB12-B1b]QMU75983.1 aliphatic sulfonate ABC transporter substrate-binding protein [Streptacidiphilus sp. PB12-B1b]
MTASIANSPARVRARRTVITAAAALAALGLLSACGGYGSKATSSSSAAAPAATGSGSAAPALSASTVHIGYYANLTHATPLIGIENGQFQKDLGSTAIKTQIFNAGPAEIEALNAGAIDIAWIGPSAALSGYTSSHGASLKIIAGATTGGAELVVNPKKIAGVADLKGKKIATPQLGNTQDVALLYYLKTHGYKENAESGAGDVSVLRIDNSTTPTAYASGQIDGAWVPEPTASKLVAEGAKVLIDERTLWPQQQFATTNVIVSQSFLKAHPDVVDAVLKASVDTNAWIVANPAQAKTDANAALKQLSGKALSTKVLNSAWSYLSVTNDPLASTLQAEAQHAVTAGLLKQPDLSGIYDLAPLNQILSADGKPTVSAAGLGQQ